MAPALVVLCASLCASAAGASARELDPAACAARFDMQRDKIIRTEESRDMGARYLSELDVGARAECRRLCCETDACDVFVYEEKSPGSCYLFSCGPPEDFRCKFTSHANFSSGVLALSRRLAELQDQEHLAPPPPTSPPPATTRPPAPSTPLPVPTTAPAAPRRCSRYQFECRAGGECIAVYNACDGVPQCADGSDEGPELGCPPAPAAPPAAPPALPAPPAWPHRLTQAQPPPHRYADVAGAAGSHIFSHKGGLLQEPEPGAPFSPFEPPPAAGWPRRPWPQSGDGGWWDEGAGGEAGRGWAVPARAQPEYAAPLYPGPQHALRDAPKKGLGLEPVPVSVPPTATPAVPPRPPPRPTGAPAVMRPPTTTERTPPTPGVVGASRHEDMEGGRSDHPPAAVLLLVLGVCMTGVAAGGVGWRVRAGARRGRRGAHKPYAHDADYLVNGMYL